ncbi:MAG: Ig-like domain repeat protein [Polyangiaceae bacterium]
MVRWVVALVAGLGAALLMQQEASAQPLLSTLTCPSNGQVITDSISSPNQGDNSGVLSQRIPAVTPPSTCGTQKTPSSPDALSVRYNAYTFTNRNLTTPSTPSCITVTLAGHNVESVAYEGSTFNPSDVTANYLADSGDGSSYSFNATTLEEFVVVVNETLDNQGGGYTLTVQGCGTTYASSIAPAFGLLSGGTDVTISGAGFLPGATAAIGGVALSNVAVGSEGTITGTTGNATMTLTPGAYDVVVTNPVTTGNTPESNINDSMSNTATLASGFSYDVPQAVSIVWTTPAVSYFGDTVLLSVTVTGTGGIPVTPTGTVTFFDSGMALGTVRLNTLGAANLFWTMFSVGTHSLTAHYSGDSFDLPGTSNPLSFSERQSGTTTTLTASANPVVENSSVTFTATLAESPGVGMPTGTVTFTADGVTNLGMNSVGVDGTATLSTSALTLGAHSIVATYSGDTDFIGSASAAVTETVTGYGSTVAVSATPSSPTFGDELTFAISVTNSTDAGTPTGSVTLKDGTNTIATLTLADGRTSYVTTTPPQAASHTYTAAYAGDTNDLAAQGTAVVNIAAAATTTTLETSNAAPSQGQSITLTANVASTVTAGTITGSVTFFDGQTSLGVATISGGAATLAVSTLATGSAHNLTATYGGNTDYATSTSGTVTVTVSAPVPDAGPEAGPEAGTDSGSIADAGHDSAVAEAGTQDASDGGSVEDAHSTADVVESDAEADATTEDSSADASSGDATVDSSVATDSGEGDGATASDAQADADAEADGGGSAAGGSSSSGCGCTTAGSGTSGLPGLFAIVGLAAALSRRRRRSR